MAEREEEETPLQFIINRSEEFVEELRAGGYDRPWRYPNKEWRTLAIAANAGDRTAQGKLLQHVIFKKLFETLLWLYPWRDVHIYFQRILEQRNVKDVGLRFGVSYPRVLQICDGIDTFLKSDLSKKVVIRGLRSDYDQRPLKRRIRQNPDEKRPQFEPSYIDPDAEIIERIEPPVQFELYPETVAQVEDLIHRYVERVAGPQWRTIMRHRARGQDRHKQRPIGASSWYAAVQSIEKIDPLEPYRRFLRRLEKDIKKNPLNK